MLDVGRVVRPHGLKGAVVVELWTDRVERVERGAELSAAGRTLVVASASKMAAVAGRDRWLVNFEGVDGRAAAEGLRDSVLQAEPLSVEGVLWVHELVGATLFEPSGAPIARIDAVEANPASDLLILEDGRVVPLTFVSRDDSGRLVVDGPPGLLDPP